MSGGASGPTPAVVVKGGRLVDGAGERDADVAVDHTGHVVEVAAGIDAGGRRIVDAEGCLVMPGLVDLHAHLREPGAEEAETVESGGRAAVRGGYSAVVAMPNTDPPIDGAAVAREVLELGRAAPCDVYVSGAITVGRRGEELAPMEEMARLGVRIFTDDGRGVQDPQTMRRAMEYARGLGVVLAQHCEDESLAHGGHMHEGEWSARLGIAAVPALAEELMVVRDLMLAEMLGVPVHLQHLSTAGSVELVRSAKQRGVRVTAEVTTHHLTLTDERCATYDPVFKVNPPLRPDTDVAAVREALLDGTIDAIATDHAPHAPETKELPFEEAPPGMLGLETALALAAGEVGLPPARLVEVLSTRPAAIAGVDDRHGGPIAPGRAANLCVFDPGVAWTVDPARGESRSRNSPYASWQLRGRVRHTLVDGDVVVHDGEVVHP